MISDNYTTEKIIKNLNEKEFLRPGDKPAIIAAESRKTILSDEAFALCSVLEELKFAINKIKW